MRIASSITTCALGLLLWGGMIGDGMAAEPTFYTYYGDALKTAVNDKGFVDYKKLSEDRVKLDAFVLSLSQLPREDYNGWSKQDQIAFWINAYNALTLRAVIDHYPVKSIKDIGSLFESVWDKLTFDVMGASHTLNQIEHEILRKRFSEPGIHMGLNCASIGCPPLLDTPFSGKELQEQLDKQARAFLADPKKFRIDRAAATVHLSPIFKWFGEDFVAKYGNPPISSKFSAVENAVLRYISGRVSDQDRAYLVEGGYRITYLDYDWNLNEQGRK